MERHKDNNYIVVRTLEELKNSRWFREWYVYAICPKCKDGWISRPNKARRILSNNCLDCCKETNEEWYPT